MRIVIMGAGALGSLIGGYLAESGEDVILVGRENHVKRIQKEGLKITGIRGRETIRVPAQLDPSGIKEPQLIIISVKSFHTRAVLEAIRPIVTEDTLIMSIQNGVTNEESISQLYGEKKAIGAAVMIHALLTEPGCIEHVFGEEIVMGPLNKENLRRTKEMAKIFRQAGIKVRISEEIMKEKWGKMLIFCVGSTINSITGLKNLTENPQIRTLMSNIAREIVEVTKKENIALPFEDPVEEILKFFEQFHPAKWKASVGRDLELGKRTEIDFLNGLIVKMGEKHGIPTPANQAVVAIVKGMEQSRILFR